MSMMSAKKEPMRRIAAALFIAVAFSGGAPGQGWPEKPARFVMGSTPGGPSDILAREIPKWAKVVKDSGARAE